MPSLTIFGINGRMGQTLVRALREPGSVWQLAGAVASPGSRRLGADAAREGAPTGVLVGADPRAALTAAAVALDFSLADSLAAHARACAGARVPLVVGTTGFDDVARAALREAATRIPVLIAPNTSVGVSVLAGLVRMAAGALGSGYDVEVSEAHHRMKRDAPSGTALALGEVVAGVRGRPLSELAVIDRQGARADGAIGFSVVRAGDIVGEHAVLFAAPGEQIEIRHRATDRITFARGALRAAAWLIGRAPGSYTMQDALGLPTSPVDSPVAHR